MNQQSEADNKIMQYRLSNQLYFDFLYSNYPNLHSHFLNSMHSFHPYISSPNQNNTKTHKHTILNVSKIEPTSNISLTTHLSLKEIFNCNPKTEYTHTRLQNKEMRTFFQAMAVPITDICHSNNTW